MSSEMNATFAAENKLATIVGEKTAGRVRACCPHGQYCKLL